MYTDNKNVLSQFLQLADFLVEQYKFKCADASAICSSYLKAFRKCPDNPDVNLDKWRLLLWTEAFDHKHTHLSHEIYRKWLQLRYHYLQISPEIKTLLKTLRQNYLLGLITNGPSCSQWEKVQRLDLQSYFDLILVSGDLPWEKPDSKIFEQACQHLRVKPINCIMVGDKLETDIEGGIQAKLGYTVWIPLVAGANLKQNDPNPDYTIATVMDLLDLLPPFSKQTVKVVNPKRMSFPDFEDCNSNSSDGS